MAKQWIKMWCIECLEGSIRVEFTSAERGVWYDLLLLAGISKTPGIIERTIGVPYSFEDIAARLKVDVDLLHRVVTKCMEEGRIYMRNGSIGISNWDKYQSVPEDKKKEFSRKFVTELEAELKQDATLVNTIETNPKKILSYADRIAKRKGVNPLSGEIKHKD